MASVKKFSRELAPHAAWRGIELLWDLARATLLAAVLALWQRLVHHWDMVTIGIVFATCLVLLLWRDRSVHREHNAVQLTKGSDSSNPEELNSHVTDPSKMAPRVRVDYVDDGRAGGKGTLVFKSDKPAIIKKVGDLVSRERYESQYGSALSPAHHHRSIWTAQSSTRCKACAVDALLIYAPS